MSIKKLLIANRGEIANRVATTAAELSIQTVSIYSEDDASCSHTESSDLSIALKGFGATAYLDAEQIIQLAIENDCDAIHPGYGFLSEDAKFAELAHSNNIIFVGPHSSVLKSFGDKVSARLLAKDCKLDIINGTNSTTSLKQCKAFFNSLGSEAAMMIKAVSGGGGRGMRMVTNADEIELAYTRCQSEAKQSFSNSDLYVEQVIQHARHIEIQIVADNKGNVIHLGERECSLQRNNQKLIEYAPCPDLSPDLRNKITDAAVTLAKKSQFTNIGTFEFLVDAEDLKNNPDNAYFAFIEANPRIQVEHTVTEELMGVDLVQTQLRIARGELLSEIGLNQTDYLAPKGFALQTRLNMETIDVHGNVAPTGGKITNYKMPSGRGIRVDDFAYNGYTTNPNFDSLLSKIIVHTNLDDFTSVLTKAARVLDTLRVEGFDTNRYYLKAILESDIFSTGQLSTKILSTRASRLFSDSVKLSKVTKGSSFEAENTTSNVNITTNYSDEHHIQTIPLLGSMVEVNVTVDQEVNKGEQLAVINSMKMEHVISADVSGIISEINVLEKATVNKDQVAFVIKKTDDNQVTETLQENTDPSNIRSDLADVIEAHRTTFDEARPEAVAKRRKTKQRTARENIADLIDEDSFIEYGALAIAAQRKRRTIEDLKQNTPADGIITGIASINGDLFDNNDTQCAVLSYDYTVLAGTQGTLNHAKKDRMFEIAGAQKLPVILFTEGGGGRPGDTDYPIVAGLNCLAFSYFAKLSGLVPLVGINSGRCFAGNAALLGCCDVIIATQNSSIGMGGPAMIEGGGLGIVKPDDVGPSSVQSNNGVIDILVSDEEAAVGVAKKYISYFQGDLKDWKCDDQQKLRQLIPENRLRVYKVKTVIEQLMDSESVLELRESYGIGMITSFARIEGKAIGVIANNPEHLGGAIDGPSADKASRFMQLCDAYDIPILFLCDTPGFMVGTESEKTAVVRRFSRMFVTAASMSIPFFTVVLRKGYGLGAQSMAGGSFMAPIFTIAWPTGEFGAMGLEGAIKLGFRKELEAIEDEQEKQTLYDKMVANAYKLGKATNMAAGLEIDAVIDPKDTRKWIISGIKAAPKPKGREGKKRPSIDTW